MGYQYSVYARYKPHNIAYALSLELEGLLGPNPTELPSALGLFYPACYIATPTPFVGYIISHDPQRRNTLVTPTNSRGSRIKTIPILALVRGEEKSLRAPSRLRGSCTYLFGIMGMYYTKNRGTHGPPDLMNKLGYVYGLRVVSNTKNFSNWALFLVIFYRYPMT